MSCLLPQITALINNAGARGGTKKQRQKAATGEKVSLIVRVCSRCPLSWWQGPVTSKGSTNTAEKDQRLCKPTWPLSDLSYPSRAKVPQTVTAVDFQAEAANQAKCCFSE